MKWPGIQGVREHGNCVRRDGEDGRERGRGVSKHGDLGTKDG